MAFIDDFSYDLATGNVRHVSGATRYPVIDMHEGLQLLAYQETKSGDDELDITDLVVPSRRNSDTDIELGSYSLGGPTIFVNIDATAAEFLFGGSITQNAGAVRYSGLAIAGDFSIDATAQPQVVQNSTKLANYWGQSFSPDAGLGYAVRILVQSRVGDADIDGGRVRVQSAGYGFDYRQGGTVLGRNESVAAVGSIAADAFNQTPIATIAALVDITNVEGFQNIDYNNGNGAQPYYDQWSRGANSNNDTYERIKWETRDGSTETLHGVVGELFQGATHTVNYDALAGGSFAEGTPLLFASGAVAQVLADDSANSRIHIQLLTGLIAIDNEGITQGGVTAVVNGAPISRALGINSYAGNYSGAWLGAFGVGFAPGDLGNADTVVDLNGVSQSPPNNQNVTVSNATVGETRVIVGKDDGTGRIDKDEYAAAAGNDLGDSTIVVTTPITNVPAAGTVRIGNGVGDDRYEYSSFSGSTYNITTTLTQNYSAAANVYPTIIDVLAPTATLQNAWVYTSDTLLVGQALDSGASPTRQFPIAGTFTATGFSVSLVNTPDA